MLFQKSSVSSKPITGHLVSGLFLLGLMSLTATPSFASRQDKPSPSQIAAQKEDLGYLRQALSDAHGDLDRVIESLENFDSNKKSDKKSESAAILEARRDLQVIADHLSNRLDAVVEGRSPETTKLYKDLEVLRDRVQALADDSGKVKVADLKKEAVTIKETKVAAVSSDTKAVASTVKPDAVKTGSVYGKYMKLVGSDPEKVAKTRKSRVGDDKAVESQRGAIAGLFSDFNVERHTVAKFERNGRKVENGEFRDVGSHSTIDRAVHINRIASGLGERPNEQYTPITYFDLFHDRFVAVEVTGKDGQKKWKLGEGRAIEIVDFMRDEGNRKALGLDGMPKDFFEDLDAVAKAAATMTPDKNNDPLALAIDAEKLLENLRSDGATVSCKQVRDAKASSATDDQLLAYRNKLITELNWRTELAQISKEATLSKYFADGKEKELSDELTQVAASNNGEVASILACLENEFGFEVVRRDSRGVRKAADSEEIDVDASHERMRGLPFAYDGKVDAPEPRRVNHPVPTAPAAPATPAKEQAKGQPIPVKKAS